MLQNGETNLKNTLSSIRQKEADINKLLDNDTEITSDDRHKYEKCIDEMRKSMTDIDYTLSQVKRLNATLRKQ